MNVDPSRAKERKAEPPVTGEGLPRYEHSRFWQFFVDAGLAWDMFWVVALAVGGICALGLAIFTLDIVAAALALVALPAAFIMWCIAKGVRDVGRDA